MGGLEDLHTTRVMFSLDDELDPTELVWKEANQTNTHLDG